MTLKLNELSEREKEWVIFANDVFLHIKNYTVPQYGDMGEDLATDFDAEYCIKSAQKYLARFGKSQRKGEEKLDLLKTAHYLALAHSKMQTS